MDFEGIKRVMRVRMAELGMSQTGLAGELGVHRSRVSAFFRSGGHVRLETLERYVEVLDLEIRVVLRLAEREKMLMEERE